ncbi:unnamed protein product [Anisakis simplex]|uniref:Uncharacterized protein n=1 Tax=Anisakis simplex TaxID=6269 RepID=A0A0M3JB99_ANISI|nr:unnamed protein product [Anisakis simplex]
MLPPPPNPPRAPYGSGGAHGVRTILLASTCSPQHRPTHLRSSAQAQAQAQAQGSSRWLQLPPLSPSLQNAIDEAILAASRPDLTSNFVAKPAVVVQSQEQPSSNNNFWCLKLL